MSAFEPIDYPESTEEGESAYPLPEYFRSMGLTKRERFAMAAMQGLLSDLDSLERATGGGENLSFDSISRIAINHADSILDQLNKTKDK